MYRFLLSPAGLVQSHSTGHLTSHIRSGSVGSYLPQIEDKRGIYPKRFRNCGTKFRSFGDLRTLLSLPGAGCISERFCGPTRDNRELCHWRFPNIRSNSCRFKMTSRTHFQLTSKNYFFLKFLGVVTIYSNLLVVLYTNIYLIFKLLVLCEYDSNQPNPIQFQPNPT